MKLWDIIKIVGAGIISATVPGGALLVGAVNEVLPDDKKLPPSATGDDLKNTIDSLPPDQRRALIEKEFDVDMTQIKESNSTLRTMLESDAQNPQSTRPKIAFGAFRVIAFSIITIVSVWSYGVLTNNDSLVKAVVDGWPFVLAVIAPLVTLLHAYFGVLKQEHKNRLNAAGGNTSPSGLTGVISALINRK